MVKSSFRYISAKRVTVAEQHPDTTAEVPEFHQQQLQEDSHRVHQHPVVGVGAGVLVEYVSVASQADRDRYELEVVREAGEDLVPEPQGEVQEGGPAFRAEPEVLLPEDVRQEEGWLHRRLPQPEMRPGRGHREIVEKREGRGVRQARRYGRPRGSVESRGGSLRAIDLVASGRQLAVSSGHGGEIKSTEGEPDARSSWLREGCAQFVQGLEEDRRRRARGNGREKETDRRVFCLPEHDPGHYRQSSVQEHRVHQAHRGQDRQLLGNKNL